MNKEQFTEKVLSAEQSLYRIARSILQNDADCEDAMQNAVLSAYSKLDSLKKEEYFQTWLTRILVNECYTLLRKRKTHVSYEEYMGAGEDAGSAFQSEEAHGFSEVFEEIQKLEETYRIPFVLHYVEGYSVREISKMLDCSQGSIKTRLYRSRNMLKESLKGVEGYE